jgi:hypothetical protein
MPQRSFYIKKLLLVMLVPVLVLGLFSCGKVLDADVMPLDMQGSYLGTRGLVLVLAGNEATIYSATDALITATYRVDVSANTDDYGKYTSGGADEIQFVGFTDKKKKEIATAKFTYTLAGAGAGGTGSTIYFDEVIRSDDALSNLVPETGDTYTKY